MKHRLAERKAQKKFDRESDEAIALVHSRVPQAVLEAEAKALPPDEGFSGKIINRCDTHPGLPVLVLNGILNGLINNWVFWFSFAFILWAAGLVLF